MISMRDMRQYVSRYSFDIQADLGSLYLEGLKSIQCPHEMNSDKSSPYL